MGLRWAKRRQLKEYSKGMTRRIGLAQALINEPELIVLDEPTSGLDPIGTREMKDLILKLRDEGKTVLMCSHLLADVQDVCDRIAILHQGELKELGRVDSLLKVRDVTEIRTTALSDEAKAEIEAVVRRHNGNVLHVDNPTTHARRAVPDDRPRQRSPARPPRDREAVIAAAIAAPGFRIRSSDSLQPQLPELSSWFSKPIHSRCSSGFPKRCRSGWP